MHGVSPSWSLVVGPIIALSGNACTLDNPAFGGESGSASTLEINNSATETSETSATSATSATSGVPADWWDPEWRGRRRLIVDNQTSETLVDAPIAILLDPTRFTYANAAADGHDLRLVDPSSNTALALEVERWTPMGSSSLWARAPLLPPGTTELWLYWDNPLAPPASDEDLWAPSYDAVYHLSERLIDEERTIKDASADNDGSAFQTMSADNSTRGVVGGAVNFRGVSEDNPKTGDLIVVDSAPLNTDDWSAITLEVWIRHTHAGEHRILCKSPTTAPGDHIFAIGLHDDGPGQDSTVVYLRLGADEEDAVELRTAPGAVEHGESEVWRHLAMTWDGSAIRLYIDGAPEPIKIANTDAIYTASIEHPGATLRDHPIPITFANLNDILVDEGDARFWRGDLDEIRLSRRAHSEAWIRFQVASMRDTVIDYSADEEAIEG